MKTLLCLLAIISIISIAYGERMRNIDYLSFGYDLFRGNPLSTTGGVDPGFKIHKIFQFTYDEHQQSSDGRWDVPDHVTVVREDSCSLEFQSTAISGSQKYSEFLETFISAEAGGWGAKFKGSVDFKILKEHTEKFKELYTTSKGECKVYTGTTDDYLTPSLSNDFAAAVETLPETYSSTEYLRFIFNYGTHYIDQIHMGARFSCVSRMTEAAWTSLLQMSISVTTAASASAFGFSGAIDTRTEYQKKIAKEFDSAKNETLLSIVGTKPVKEHGPIEWAQQAVLEPMPIRYSIRKISELLDERFFRGRVIKKNLNKLQAAMEIGLKEYCESLVKKGIMLDCDNPQPDPPFPKVMNSCRHCTEACGKDFPIVSGAMSNSQFFAPSPYLHYAKECVTPFGGYGGDAPSMLCCQPENDSRYGSCRTCLSCGGAYSENMGSVTFVNQAFTAVAVFSFDDQCHGELRNRGAEIKPSLCCKKPAICSYCASCGGDYPEEAAVYHNFAFMYVGGVLVYSGKGEHCQGIAPAGLTSAKLCCKTKGEPRTEK